MGGRMASNLDTLGGTPVREEDFTLDPTGNWTDYIQKTSGTTVLDQDRDHNHVNEIDTDDTHGDADNPITEDPGTAWADPVHDAPARALGRRGSIRTVDHISRLSSGWQYFRCVPHAVGRSNRLLVLST